MANREQMLGVFGLVISDMAHKWRRVLDQRLKPKNLSQSTWRTLYFVGRAETGILQKDLAIAIGIEGPSLVRLLDVLEEDGLISREVSTIDRRGKIIRLTGRGEIELQEGQAIADAVREEMLGGISATDLGACLDVFQRIDANAMELMPLKDRSDVDAG